MLVFFFFFFLAVKVCLRVCPKPVSVVINRHDGKQEFPGQHYRVKKSPGIERFTAASEVMHQQH